jgi:hypothetical protein
MENYIFDGKPHILDRKYGYITKKIIPMDLRIDRSSFMDEVDSLLENYVEYLYENDKDKVIRYLMEVLRQQSYNFHTDECYQLIYHPPHLSGCLGQHAILSLKFTRADNDNLWSNNDKD